MRARILIVGLALLCLSPIARADTGPHWVLKVSWLDDTGYTYNDPNDGWIYLPASATRRGWSCSLMSTVRSDYYQGVIHCSSPGSEQEVASECTKQKKADSVLLTLYEPDGSTWLAKMQLDCVLR